MNHGVKHIPQKSHLLIFLLIITDDFWCGHAHLYAVNNKLSGFLQRLTGEALREKKRNNTIQSARDLNEQCMRIFSFAIQGTATPEIFYNHLGKGNWKKPCTSWAHINQKKTPEGGSKALQCDGKEKDNWLIRFRIFFCPSPWPLPSPCPSQHFVIHHPPA